MSDIEKSENPVSEDREKKIRERKKKRKARKNHTLIIIIFILLVSIGCTLYINMDNPLLYSMFSGIGINVSDGESVIEFEKTEDYAISDFGGNAIVARNTQVFCIDSDMNERWQFKQSNAAPVIKTCGKYTLTYSFDVPGAVVAKNGDAKEIATENPVIGGAVNKNGYCAIVTREKGYKAQIIVYSNEGEIVYKWHSAENYIIDVAVSPDNNCLAVATADFSTDVASGGLMMFNFSQEKPFAGQILENNLIMEIKYTGKDSLIAIGDTGAVIFSGNGQKKSEYLYADKKLTNYDIGTENGIVLALNEGDSVLNDTEIKILSPSLKEKGEGVVSGAVSCIDFVDDKILAVTDRKLSLLSTRGREIKKLELNKDIKGAVLFGNGDDVLITSGSIAEIVELK